MDKLSEIYDSELFRTEGHKLVDQLADWLKKSLHPYPDDSVITWQKPELELKKWETFESSDPSEIFKTIMDGSIRIHHPHYMGHQVCAPAPMAVLAALQGALLNNGGAVFEMGQASCSLEKYLTDYFKSWFGYGIDGDGFFTSGGTIANITALLCARALNAGADIWEEGTKAQYAVMVSEEAHYCIDRAVRIMGWGSAGIISVPVDENFRIRTDLLEQKYNEAIQSGIKVVALVGSAPSTATGMYDPLEELGKFCAEKNIWFHIDAAHGGPAVFSERFSYLMKGCYLADSITVDAHKMMMVPGLTTMLFFKNYKNSYQTFAQKAHYLWGDNEPEWYNYGKRTMECTKLMMSTRVYMLLKTYGVRIFGDFVDQCYNLAADFYNILNKYEQLETAVKPDSNIVCFRYRHKDDHIANKINLKIRETLLSHGSFYIVQTKIKGLVYLRTTLISPATRQEHLKLLTEEIVRIGDHESENL